MPSDEFESAEIWQKAMLNRFRRMKYAELALLPEEEEVQGPENPPPNVRFFVRRRTVSEYEEDLPLGTVLVSVCMDVYENGKFRYGMWPWIEKTPKGKLLDPMRGWEGD